MGKRRPAFSQEQLGFSFDAPAKVSTDGELAGIERRISSAVATILNGTGRSRYDVAGGVSRLLDEEVSKLMLDAYASEARENHNISAGRFIALIAETGRYDVLDAILRPIGAAILVGDEVLVAERGQIRSQIEQLKRREAELSRLAPMIGKKKGGA